MPTGLNCTITLAEAADLARVSIDLLADSINTGELRASDGMTVARGDLDSWRRAFTARAAYIGLG